MTCQNSNIFYSRMFDDSDGGNGVRFICTSTVDMTTYIAQDLLRAANQYIL